MFEIADRLRELNAQKKELKEQTGKLNAEIDAVNKQLYDLMVSEEVQSFNRDGTTFYLHSEQYASVVAGAHDELHLRLREHGFGDIIKESVNVRTLTAFVKEQSAATENEELPEWMKDLVNVYVKDEVRMKKS